MASFMPAACNPVAIDQAIERLLATPKTIPFLPCRSEDMRAPRNGKEYQRKAGIYHTALDSQIYHRVTEKQRNKETKKTVAPFVFGFLCDSVVKYSHLAAPTCSAASAVLTGQLAATNDRP